MGWVGRGGMREFPGRSGSGEKGLGESQRRLWWEESGAAHAVLQEPGHLRLTPANSPDRQKDPNSQGSDPACLNFFFSHGKTRSGWCLQSRQNPVGLSRFGMTKVYVMSGPQQAGMPPLSLRS